MAGQDFARVKAPKRKKQESNPASGSLAAIFGIVFAAIVCFAAGYWLGGSQGNLPETANGKLAAAQAQLDEKMAQLKLQQARIDELEESIVKWKNRVEQKASDKLGELQFYKNLPRQSVTPAPISEAASMPAAAKPSPAAGEAEKTAPRTIDAPAAEMVKKEPPASKTSDKQAYRLQIVSYQSRDDAASFQRKLFNAGFSASVQPVDLPGRGKWYRVYAGPFTDEASALKARHDIQARMKIRGMLVRDH